MLHKDIPHESDATRVHLGTAGWNIRREHAGKFLPIGTHLERYAALFNAVEINSCFYRPHRFATYERWAASVPSQFRFAVKLPKAITHESRLVDSTSLVERFLEESAGLGLKRGPVLIQLPPSLEFDPVVAVPFFTEFRHRFDGSVVFEPRHPSWFSSEVESLLIDCRIARVAADPPRVPEAGQPAGYDRVVYFRLHGAPRVYYSAYSAEELDRVTEILRQRSKQGASTWCIFDNTALGAATTDALAVKSRLLEGRAATV
ncbi:MAG: DUF72 domain-containing protein [Gemmatimonadaceae bacterium]